MEFLNEKEVEQIRQIYTKGTIIELISMDDPYTKLVSGDRGIVDHVDDAGQIHVRWDRGSSLALIPEIDSFKIVEK